MWSNDVRITGSTVSVECAALYRLKALPASLSCHATEGLHSIPSVRRNILACSMYNGAINHWPSPTQVGHLPANIDIPWRQSAMTGDVTPLGADLTGGWITGSEAGVVLERV